MSNRCSILSILVLTTMTSSASSMAGQLDEFPPDLPVADVAEGARADTSLPESVRGRSRQDGTWRCTFSFRPDGGAREADIEKLADNAPVEVRHWNQ